MSRYLHADFTSSLELIISRYMESHRFAEIERVSKTDMKRRHTIVEKWPTRPKIRPGQIGAIEEFKHCIASGHAGTERYVEWRRRDPVEHEPKATMGMVEDLKRARGLAT